MTYEEAKERLEELYHLDENWDGEGSQKISRMTRFYMANAIENLYDLNVPFYNIYPGPNGECCMLLRNDKTKREVEIIIKEDPITYKVSKNPQSCVIFTEEEKTWMTRLIENFYEIKAFIVE